MQILYSWVKPLLYFVIFMTMVENILSESSFRKYIRVFSGMMLILVILMPLKTVFPEAWKDIYKEGESLEAEEKIEREQYLKEMEETKAEILEEKTKEAVSSKIKEECEQEGLKIKRVVTEGEYGEEGYFEIERILVIMQSSEEKEKAESYLKSRYSPEIIRVEVRG